MTSSLNVAQGKVLNGLVDDSERPKFNLAMPQLLMDEYERVAKSYGSGRKWMVLSAAVAHFIALPKRERDEWMAKVAMADLRRDFGDLVPQQGGDTGYAATGGKPEEPPMPPKKPKRPR